MLIISEKVFEDILDHARKTYPEECCGILLGSAEAKNRFVMESRPAHNTSAERRHDRYRIHDAELAQVIRAARRLSMDVIGFYHSHPDYPSYPSRYDEKMATWPVCSYLIVSVVEGASISAQSWVIPDGKDSFVEESLSVMGAGLMISEDARVAGTLNENIVPE